MRINALTRSLEAAFVKHGVPFQIVKGLAFFERKENRDVLAYLRLLVNPQDTRQLPAHRQRAGPRHRQGVARPAPGVRRPTARSACSRRPGRSRSIPEIKGKAATGLRDFHQHDDRPADAARPAAARADPRRCWRRPATGDAARVGRRGGRRAAGEHRGTHHRRQAVPRRGPRAHHRRLPRTDHAGARRGRLGRAGRPRLGDDAARGQGAGVPGRVHARGRAGTAAARAEPGATTRRSRRSGGCASSA